MVWVEVKSIRGKWWNPFTKERLGQITVFEAKGEVVRIYSIDGREIPSESYYRKETWKLSPGQYWFLRTTLNGQMSLYLVTVDSEGNCKGEGVIATYAFVTTSETLVAYLDEENLKEVYEELKRRGIKVPYTIENILSKIPKGEAFGLPIWGVYVEKG